MFVSDDWNHFQAPIVSEKASYSFQQKSPHIKLWIGTVKSLDKHPSIENAALFNQQVVTYVVSSF